MMASSAGTWARLALADLLGFVGLPIALLVPAVQNARQTACRGHIARPSRIRSAAGGLVRRADYAVKMGASASLPAVQKDQPKTLQEIIISLWPLSILLLQWVMVRAGFAPCRCSAAVRLLVFVTVVFATGAEGFSSIQGGPS